LPTLGFLSTVLVSLGVAAQVPAPAPLPQSSTGVAATVNEAVISNYDLDQRTALFVATSGVRPTAQTLPQIQAQVLRTLEDETIEMQEAGKHKVTATRAEVEKAVLNIAEDNKLTPEQLLTRITQTGVTATTFRQQISAQIIWQKLVSARYGPDVMISDQQIDEAMNRLKQGADKPQFLLSEIYFGVDKPEDETNVRVGAEQIAEQIKQGAPFPTVAGQFSQSPSAADGGDIGWVIQGQLADELDHALADLRPGQIAGPIRAEGGYYVLQLRDRREPQGSKMLAEVPAVDPKAPIPLDRFLIPLPANPDATLKDRAMTLMTNVKNQTRSCADLPAIASQLQGTVYTRLGAVDPKNLDAQIRDGLAMTGPGDALKPFFSPAGLELILRCDGVPSKVGAFELPSREQLQQQLFVQQMSLYAKGYLRDLRRNAIVYATGR
jgi:peptidyl-prolyl cis-trans isomerase SurA